MCLIWIAELHDRVASLQKALSDYEGVNIFESDLSEIKTPAYRMYSRLTLEQHIRLLYLISEYESLLVTLDLIQKRNKRSLTKILLSESLEMNTGTISMQQENKEENILDVDGAVGATTDGVSILWPNRGIDGLSLDDFFSRPIELDTFTISALSGTLQRELRVWDKFSLESAVRAKFKNYSYFRGKMKLKIVISGTNFHYGRILFSYQPYADRNAVLLAHEAAYAANPLWDPLYLNYLSQSHESVIMDPKENKPFVMDIPFYSPKNAHRLYNDDTIALAAASSYDDFFDAGTLYMRTLNSINATSATPSPISVTIYGWMENVELGVPTGTIIELTSESEDVTEVKKGTVEKVSSYLADTMGALNAIPTFRPFATPLQIVSSAVRDVSHIFGWSRPDSELVNQRMKVYGFANGANTSGADTSYKLSLDPKQGLSMRVENIDSEQDHMVINYISNHFSYLTTFQWDPIDTPMSNPIWYCAVHPLLNSQFTNPLITTQAWNQPTALSYAAQPFMYWNGTVTYRFEFVVSGFHRGKMAVFYEPNISQWALMSTSIELNKQYMHIIDLQEVQCIEYVVDWASRRSWLRCAIVNGGSVSTYKMYGDSTEFQGQNLAEYANGFIALVPFTNLQSPDDSTIDINVYVSSEDLRVNGLNVESIPADRILLSESCCVSHDVSQEVLNPTDFDPTHISGEHFGERPVSFRSLCKRFMMTSLNYSTQGLPCVMKAPIYPLPVPTLNSSTTTYETNLYSYLRYAYLGMRGGMKHRYMSVDGADARSYQMTVACLAPPSDTNDTFGFVPRTNDIVFVSPTGSVSNELLHCGSIEVTLPYYSNNLFAFSFATDTLGINTGNQADPVWYRNFYVHLAGSDQTPGQHRYLTSSIAEDFNFLRFSGAVPFNAPQF